MGIGIESECDTGVSKLLGNYLGRHARGQCQGRRSVTQIIEADSRQFRSVQNVSEVAQNEVSLVESVAICVSEDEISRGCWRLTSGHFFRRRATLFLQKLEYPILELYHAPATRAFGIGELPAAALPALR